jgi:hypothetical protein
VKQCQPSFRDAHRTAPLARISALFQDRRKLFKNPLREKGGKVNEMGCHDKLEQYLDEYIAAAGIAQDKKGPLFRAAIGRTGKLSERSMSRVDAWYMVRRRARDAGIETAIAIILSGASVSRIIWNAVATLTSPSGWRATRTSKRRNSTTGAATK